MKYVGSKNRQAKHIISVTLKDISDNLNKKFINWVEPFVGGANLIDKVPTYFNRYGYDSNKYVIALLKALSAKWEPPLEVTEEIYRHIQHNRNSYPDHLVGYAGFCLSYGGKFYGGYRRDSVGKRDYSREAYNNTVKQSTLLTGINFECIPYQELNIPDYSIVYCDPPYANTTSYAGSGKFDSDKFWNWVTELSKNPTLRVYVSEFSAPNNWVTLWESKPRASSLTKDTGSKKAVEKLFTYREP